MKTKKTIIKGNLKVGGLINIEDIGNGIVRYIDDYSIMVRIGFQNTIGLLKGNCKLIDSNEKEKKNEN